IRAMLLRLSGQVHLLLVTMHHIVSDAWSLGVFVRELAALYGAAVASGGTGEGTPSLRPLPIQYADYAVWQRAWMQGDAQESQLAYWRAQLAELPLLDLPTDHPRPLLPRLRGATFGFALANDLPAALAALSRREGVTLFMTLLAAFDILLA